MKIQDKLILYLMNNKRLSYSQAFEIAKQTIREAKEGTLIPKGGVASTLDSAMLQLELLTEGDKCERK